MNKSLISNYSGPWTWSPKRILGIPSNHLPCITKPHPTDIEERNGQTSVVMLFRWLLSVDYIWFGPIHCGLFRTSPVGLHSPRLVPQVSTYHRYMGLLTYQVRCTALNSDVDGKVKNGILMNTLKHSWMPWMRKFYGLIMVSFLYKGASYSISSVHFLMWLKAIHSWIPLCQYPWAPLTKHITSNDQRDLQRPPSGRWCHTSS